MFWYTPPPVRRPFPPNVHFAQANLYFNLCIFDVNLCINWCIFAINWYIFDVNLCILDTSTVRTWVLANLIYVLTWVLTALTWVAESSMTILQAIIIGNGSRIIGNFSNIMGNIIGNLPESWGISCIPELPWNRINYRQLLRSYWLSVARGWKHIAWNNIIFSCDLFYRSMAHDLQKFIRSEHWAAPLRTAPHRRTVIPDFPFRKAVDRIYGHVYICFFICT